MRNWLLLCVALVTTAAEGRSFSHGVDGSWAFSEQGGLCVLEQPVADFGVIRFVGAPDGGLHLEVLGHREVFAEGGVSLFQVAPPWSPAHPEHALLGTVEQRAGSSLLIADPLATRVLMALYHGYEAHVQHTTWYGGDADVRIGNEHLRPRYQAFARCIEGATAAGWASFERTRIEYANNADGLSEQDQRRLRRVAEYVLADGAVTHVYVDGHTDDAGTILGNVELSKRRADIVADFLAAAGVPRERLVVRYHAAQYPVATEPTEAARAQNRRTTVRLERQWSEGGMAAR